MKKILSIIFLFLILGFNGLCCSGRYIKTAKEARHNNH